LREKAEEREVESFAALGANFGAGSKIRVNDFHLAKTESFGKSLFTCCALVVELQF
jgi:hypothetical protein